MDTFNLTECPYYGRLVQWTGCWEQRARLRQICSTCSTYAMQCLVLNAWTARDTHTLTTLRASTDRSSKCWYREVGLNWNYGRTSILYVHSNEMCIKHASFSRRAPSDRINPYPTAFPYGNGMVLHFYQQQESSTTKTVHKVINKGLKAYV